MKASRSPVPIGIPLALALCALCLLAPSFAQAASLASAAPEAGDAFTRALAKGPLYAALAAFAGGFVVSLTPCVYPMVAVTVSVFGLRHQIGSSGSPSSVSVNCVQRCVLS